MPKEPALVDIRKSFILQFALNSLTSLSLSCDEVEPSKPFNIQITTIQLYFTE